MQIQYLIVREGDDVIVGSTWRPDPDAGPTYPQGGSPIAGTRLVQHGEEFTRAGRADTDEARLVDGVVVWVETSPLKDVIAAAVAAIDGAADAVRLEVISKQTNAEEYRRAEQQAREHAAAGYPADDVPSCVASWAKAKHRDAWTSKDAADDIIATADRWYGLLDAIRDLRLCAKEDARHAADAAEVAARAGQFSNDLFTLMKGLA